MSTITGRNVRREGITDGVVQRTRDGYVSCSSTPLRRPDLLGAQGHGVGRSGGPDLEVFLSGN
jgi:hypothetical protein